MLDGSGGAGLEAQEASVLTRAGMPCCASACWSAAGSNICLKVSVSVPLALLVRVKAAVWIVPVPRAGAAVPVVPVLRRGRTEDAGQA